MFTRPSMLVIFMTIFIDLLGFGIVLPLSPFYAEHFGASPAQVGMMQASYSLMQFIIAPIWGRWSDRVGRRPVLLLSLLGSAMSYAMFAFADHLWVLFAARILQGSFAANFSVAQAYVADTTTEANRSKGMGMVGAAFGLGFIFGPAIGAYLSDMGPHVAGAFGLEPGGAFGMGFPALAASLVCFVNFVSALFILPESLDLVEARKAVRKKISRFKSMLEFMQAPRVGWLILVFFLATFAIANLESTLALFTEERFHFGVKQTGQFFAFIGVVMAFTQGFLIRKLFPRFGERKMLLLGPLVGCLGYFLTTGAGSTSFLAFTMALVALGSGLTNPAMLGAISLLTDKDKQGAVLGITQSYSSLGRIIGPLCGGFAFGHFGSSAPYWVAGFATLLALIIIYKNKEKLPDVRHPHGH